MRSGWFLVTAVAIPSSIQLSDGLVVGAGISGLSAALEAARGGARVIVVDMWSIFGGRQLETR